MANHESRLARWLIPFVIAVATFVAFLPALSAGFVTWDDDRNFTDNFSYRGLGVTQLRWMWTTFQMGHYTPLTWMTLGLDYELWGMNASGYHLTSLGLHTINAVVFYFLARRLLRIAGTAAGAVGATAVPALAALLFAIHPLRAESVVWITERRDVLSLLFVLASIIAYLKSVDDGPFKRRWFWTSVLLYVCALLSKATAMSLPAVLLLLNVYPLRRIEGRATWWNGTAKRVYAELLPFAILTAATVVLSIIALKPPQQLSAGGKLAVSAYSLSFYLWKTLAPSSLAPLYEMPQQVNPLAPMFLVSYGVVIGLGALTWIFRRRTAALAAWVAFVLMILPMLGVVQNGPQIAADRYTYHAAPALALLLAGASSFLTRRRPNAFVGVGAAAVLALGVLTWRQTLVWHDSQTLWRRVLSVNDYAMHNWGVALARQGKLEEAIAHFREALVAKPDHAEARDYLARATELLRARAAAITP